MKKRIASGIVFLIITCVIIFPFLIGKENRKEGNPGAAQGEARYRAQLQAGALACMPFEEADRLAQVEEQDLLNTVSPAVVRLDTGELFGSGVIFKMTEECIYILTNQHLLTESQELTVTFFDGIEGRGEAVFLSEAFDMGILEVKLQDMGYFTAESYRYAYWEPAAMEELLLGDELFILGSADYPAGNLSYGTVGNLSVYMEEFDTQMLWAYCEVKAGMSGAGVFDHRGRLIGIVCGGNEWKEAAVLTLDNILQEWAISGY